jgi:hypothetical protein
MNSSELVRAALRKSGRAAMNPRGLIPRLAKAAGLADVETISALQELRYSGEVSCSAWDPNGRPAAKLFLSLEPAPLQPHEERWSFVLAEHFGSIDCPEAQVLLSCACALKSMPSEDMATLLLSLCRLKEEMLSDPARFRGRRQFDVSAEYLLASSKLLKVLPDGALLGFGIDVSLLQGSPHYVIVAGSANPRATILVENPHSFEAAVLADVDADFCWVATYGYGLSKVGENYGEQLVELMGMSDQVICLQRRAVATELDMALGQGRELFFWGDLDLSGLDIYGRLKAVLPTIQLCPLYTPMVEIQQNGGGHSYVGTQKERQTLGAFPYAEITKLASLCRTRGVDQEAVVLDSRKLQLYMSPERSPFCLDKSSHFQ